MENVQDNVEMNQDCNKNTDDHKSTHDQQWTDEQEEILIEFLPNIKSIWVTSASKRITFRLLVAQIKNVPKQNHSACIRKLESLREQYKKWQIDIKDNEYFGTDSDFTHARFERAKLVADRYDQIEKVMQIFIIYFYKIIDLG